MVRLRNRSNVVWRGWNLKSVWNLFILLAYIRSSEALTRKYCWDAPILLRVSADVVLCTSCTWPCFNGSAVKSIVLVVPTYLCCPVQITVAGPIALGGGRVHIWGCGDSPVVPLPLPHKFWLYLTLNPDAPSFIFDVIVCMVCLAHLLFSCARDCRRATVTPREKLYIILSGPPFLC